MTITERTLREWRRQALQQLSLILELQGEKFPVHNRIKEENERILRLTQELLDLALLKRSKS